MPFLRVQVVIVSPLQRTLETAAGVFGGDVGRDDAKSGLLMRSQGDALHERTAHEPVALRAHGPPFVACEQCRERVGAPNISRLKRWCRINHREYDCLLKVQFAEAC